MWLIHNNYVLCGGLGGWTGRARVKRSRTRSKQCYSDGVFFFLRIITNCRIVCRPNACRCYSSICVKRAGCDCPNGCTSCPAEAISARGNKRIACNQIVRRKCIVFIYAMYINVIQTERCWIITIDTCTARAILYVKFVFYSLIFSFVKRYIIITQYNIVFEKTPAHRYAFVDDYVRFFFHVPTTTVLRIK